LIGLCTGGEIQTQGSPAQNNSNLTTSFTQAIDAWLSSNRVVGVRLLEVLGSSPHSRHCSPTKKKQERKKREKLDSPQEKNLHFTA